MSRAIRNQVMLRFFVLLFLLALGGCEPSGESQPSKAGPSGVASKETQLQVAMLLNGPAADWGYNQAHREGLEFVKARFNAQINTKVLEKIQETADAERVMDRLINGGASVIIATSFGYQDATVKTARRHPDVRFLQAWGFKHGPNLASYSAKMYQAWYLMGRLAGQMTKTNKLGIVAAHPIPPMKWQINAYVLGARAVNPAVTATVSFINHWFDPVLSAQASEALIAQGHDVVCGVLDNSVAVAQTAERKGAWLIGHNADLTRFAPTRHLAGTKWLWGHLYEDELRLMMNDKWKGGSDRSGGLREGYVGITPLASKVPAEVRADVQAAKERLVRGQLQVYEGLIRDNAGKERVATGRTLSHDEIMAIDWFVEGVQAR